MVNAGDLDREITLVTATELPASGSGEVLFDWDHATQETIWAQWLPGGTRETWQIAQTRGEIDGVYKIYYRDEPKPDRCRILGHDGRTYDLKPAIEVDRRAGWLLPVVARAEQ